LWDAVLQFIENPNIVNFQNIRKLIGLRANVLATTLTFPALACPDKFPMVDTQVAKWVNKHYNTEHSIHMINKLTKFHYNGNGVLMGNDYNNYLNWVAWCRETSELLTKPNKEKWRPRDVEMAVFTAQRNNVFLNPLTRTSGT